jgi:hypothetical protein
VEAIQFNYRLCASLHNKIFQLGWVASGRTFESCPSQTYWEHYSPLVEIADRINIDLVQFLKRAYSHAEAPEFFYFLKSLTHPRLLLDDEWFKDRGTDRFILLYPATGFKMGDEMGLVFDQQTCKVAFIEDFEDIIPIVDNGYGWKPLEDVLSAYLEMIEEGKIEVATPDGKWTRKSPSDSFGPWLFHHYTAADVQKSAQAFKRLLNAIEDRVLLLPTDSSNKKQDRAGSTLPWAESSTLDTAQIHTNTFTRAFCEETAKYDREVPFQYIAPGIRLPTADEFIAQPFLGKSWLKHPLGAEMPVLLFRADDPTLASNNTIPTSGTWLRYDGDKGVPIPGGLYVNGDGQMNTAFENGCLFLLPFTLGSHGWARLSDGEVMGMKPWDDEPVPAEVNCDLYQTGYNGFLGPRCVQIHKVLLNWAERVESGDWEVTENGVGGGIETFREADTEHGWQKYVLPLTW